MENINREIEKLSISEKKIPDIIKKESLEETEDSTLSESDYDISESENEPE